MKKNLFFIFLLTIIITFLILPEDIFSQDDRVFQSYSSPFSQAAFVPDVSLIMDFSYAQRNFDDEKFREFEIPGLKHGHHEHHDDSGHGHSHHAANSHNGWNLNYGELALYSWVDPYFDIFAAFHLDEASFGVEELYVRAQKLPWNFQVKMGKFKSSFGRLNEQHAHYWNFDGAPVVYDVFFGGHGICEKGLQLTWIAPVDWYLLFGAEALEGENENSFGREGFHVENAAKGGEIESSKIPNLYVGFIKTSWDIGEFIFLPGISGAFGKSRINHEVNEDKHAGHAVYADTSVLGGDITIKYYFDSYRYLSLQSEYLNRNRKGSRYAYDGSKADIEMKQSGFYFQLVYKPFLLWRFGAGFDFIQQNEITIGKLKPELPDNNYKYSFMVDYNPTHFSRIRLQFNHDRTKYLKEDDSRAKYLEKDRKEIFELYLVFNMAIGAHGAHTF